MTICDVDIFWFCTLPVSLTTSNASACLPLIVEHREALISAKGYILVEI